MMAEDFAQKESPEKISSARFLWYSCSHMQSVFCDNYKTIFLEYSLCKDLLANGLAAMVQCFGRS